VIDVRDLSEVNYAQHVQSVSPSLRLLCSLLPFAITIPYQTIPSYYITMTYNDSSEHALMHA